MIIKEIKCNTFNFFWREDWPLVDMLRSTGTVSSRPIYSFPELKNLEILQCMDDLRIPLNESELNKPSVITVQRIFESFAEIFMGASKDHLSLQPNFHVVEMLDYPDLHLESISLVAFYRIISKLMLNVGIEDFSLKDLIRPEAPRLRLILSAVINFAKFREEQLTIFEEFSRRSEELSDQQNKLSKRHEELTSRISSIKSKHNEEQLAAIKILEEISAMIQALRDLKKEQNLLTGSLEELKNQKIELAKRLSETQVRLSNSRQDCIKLKSRIIHSPEKLSQIISEMQTSIQTEKLAIHQVDRKSRELQSKLESLSHLEQDLLRSLQGMESLSADIRKRDDIIQKVADEREIIDQKQILVKDLSIKETQLKRQMTSTSEKLSRLQKSQIERRERTQERLQSLNLEYKSVSEERVAALAKIEQSERMVKDLELKINDLGRNHEAEISAIRSDCVNLKAKVISYITDIRKQCQGSSNSA